MRARRVEDSIAVPRRVGDVLGVLVGQRGRVRDANPDRLDVR